MAPPKVVALGGGHGLSATLGALRHLTRELTAVVTVADNGGSSGRLRKELDCLPPGDLRMALAALCDDTEWGHTWRDILQYRFRSDGPLDYHSVGNLLIVSIWDQLGDPVEGLALVGKLLDARGTVLPMAMVPLEIAAIVRDGEESREVHGQYEVATTPGRLEHVWIDPADPPACPQAVEAVMDADAIVLGPGSWYTSVLPHLLVPELSDAIHKTKALRILTMNLVTQSGETEGLSTADHLKVLEEYASGLRFDTVIADPVAVDDVDAVDEAAASVGAHLMLRQVRSTKVPGTHDPLRLAAAYRDALDRSLSIV
ncbi:MAG TPA: uridine diphosphate-N-acetylglucosamine-binding protein YvcK [Actinomycetaceae bacterium]|nr:uridine diphosphate-N-acetylglucosamine-binding protein YvcK [Actinomycetaceae bacterium]